RSLIPLFEMDILDSFSQNRNPMFRELILHDVPGIEMDLNLFALKAIDKGIHLLRTEEEPIHEDVFDIDGDSGLFSQRHQLADSLFGPLLANIVRRRFE